MSENILSQRKFLAEGLSQRDEPQLGHPSVSVESSEVLVTPGLVSSRQTSKSKWKQYLVINIDTLEAVQFHPFSQVVGNGHCVSS